MKISVYTTLFNIDKYFPDYQEFINNVLLIADELVIATLDNINDIDLLSKETLRDDRIRVISRPDLKPFTPDFDGQMKNASLQACTGDVMIQIDADERFSPDAAQWKKLCAFFLQRPERACWVPVVNLFQDKFHASDIGKKWYLHKPGLFRGVVNFARNEDGTHDTNKSDSCELIDKDGNLVSALQYVPFGVGIPDEGLAILINDEKMPFIYHLGWLDLDRRINIISDHWQKQWDAEAGKPVELPKNKEEIKREVFEHKLPLWSE
jgi:hypothetical protein